MSEPKREALQSRWTPTVSISHSGALGALGEAPIKTK